MVQEIPSEEEDCRICDVPQKKDFDIWIQKAKGKNVFSSNSKHKKQQNKEDDKKQQKKESEEKQQEETEDVSDGEGLIDVLPCPPDSSQLGRHTWTFLHTMAAYYPESPSDAQQQEMDGFLRSFSRFYPCHYCAKHLEKRMQAHPPKTESRTSLSHWLCEVHNEVNERIGKPLFDCSRVLERWRNGPKNEDRC